MLGHFVLILALLQTPAVLADEPTPTKSTSPEEITRLIDRIDQLEKRVKELERQASRPQTVTVVPQNQQYPVYVPPQGPVYAPSQGPAYAPVVQPNQPYIPNAIPPHPYYQQAPVPQTIPADPPQPSKEQYRPVPDSWKPFNFNGMQYYIVPVDEAERLNRPPINDVKSFNGLKR